MMCIEGMQIEQLPEVGLVVVRGITFEESLTLHQRLCEMGTDLLVVCLPDDASLDVLDEAANRWNINTGQ